MMKSSKETPVKPDATPGQTSRSTLASPARRALALNSLKAAPVVVTTLSARSALAAECWSGKMSGNLSHPNNGCVLGRSPGYYKTRVGPWGGEPGWPPGFDSGCSPLDSNGSITQTCQTMFEDKSLNRGGTVPGTRFGTVFTSAPGNLKKLTLMQVLWQKEGSFAFHAIAAYFNALNFSSYVLKPDVVLEIANSILATGSYTDTSGTAWSTNQMKAYLNTTWT